MTAPEITSIVSGVVTLGLAWIGYLRLKAQGASTHTLVNARSDRQDIRIDQLTRSLTAGGVEVPPAAPPGTGPTPER